jgi:hypothetical protein
MGKEKEPESFNFGRVKKDCSLASILPINFDLNPKYLILSSLTRSDCKEIILDSIPAFRKAFCNLKAEEPPDEVEYCS